MKKNIDFLTHLQEKLPLTLLTNNYQFKKKNRRFFFSDLLFLPCDEIPVGNENLIKIDD